MKIETKFELNQYVYTFEISSKMIYKCLIYGIHIVADKVSWGIGKEIIKYSVIYPDKAKRVYEDALFATREEAEAKLRERMKCKKMI